MSIAIPLDSPPFLDWKFDADEREWIASCLNNPAFRVYCSVWIYIDHYQYHVAVWSNGTLLHDRRGHAFTLSAAKIAAEKAAFC